jgi:hypothetical protein
LPPKELRTVTAFWSDFTRCARCRRASVMVQSPNPDARAS